MENNEGYTKTNKGIYRGFNAPKNERWQNHKDKIEELVDFWVVSNRCGLRVFGILDFDKAKVYQIEENIHSYTKLEGFMITEDKRMIKICEYEYGKVKESLYD